MPLLSLVADEILDGVDDFLAATIAHGDVDDDERNVGGVVAQEFFGGGGQLLTSTFRCRVLFTCRSQHARN